MNILLRGLFTIALGAALTVVVFAVTGDTPFASEGEVSIRTLGIAYAFLIIPAVGLAFTTLDEVFYYRMGYQGNREPWFIPDLNLVLIAASVIVFIAAGVYEEFRVFAQIIAWVTVSAVVFGVLSVRARMFKHLEVVRFVDAEVEEHA